jgi:hypothetical protein
MPRVVTDIETLQEYIQGVVGNAEHHARGVDEIILPIAGAILWRKNPDRELEVHEREGRMANVLWVWIGEYRIALSYNHEQACVEVRHRNLRGRALAAFDNQTPTAEVKRFFASL